MSGNIVQQVADGQEARMRRYHDFYWDPRQNFGSNILTLHQLWLDVSDRVPSREAAQRVVDSMSEPYMRTMAIEVLAEVGDEVSFTGYVLEFIRRSEAARLDKIPIFWVFPKDEAPSLSDDEDSDNIHIEKSNVGESSSVKRPTLA